MRIALLTCLALLTLRGAALGQAPANLVEVALAAANDPRNLHLYGESFLHLGDTIRSDVVVLDGPLALAAHVEGSVFVINGDLELLSGASVAGDLVVIGGEVTGAPADAVQGEFRVSPERLSYTRDGGRLIPAAASPENGRPAGRADFLVATGKSYNRVEGLPITFGPRVRTEGSNPLRVHALAIYRTEAGLTLDPEEMGYYARIEQFLGGRRAFRVGFTAHSLIEPIEDWHLSDLENGLATFLLHRDFRDHYERAGVSLFASWRQPRSPLHLTLETRWERHYSRPAGSPWSILDNSDPWRAQPLVPEGRIGTALAHLTFDTRNDELDPATGWFLRGRLERSFSSGLDMPRAISGTGDPLPTFAGEFRDPFTSGFVDIRRYNRVDPRSRLNFRLLAGGSLGRAPLPAQRQHALGGEGSLPGYSLFTLDCGARTELVSVADRPFFPRYGCDSFALLQADFRGKFSFRFDWDSIPWQPDGEERENEEWGIGWDLAPDWTFFVDVGRAWRHDDGPDEELAADVGAGILLDRLGLFAAVPLRGNGGINLFVRLGPRF